MYWWRLIATKRKKHVKVEKRKQQLDLQYQLSTYYLFDILAETINELKTKLKHKKKKRAHHDIRSIGLTFPLPQLSAYF